MFKNVLLITDNLYLFRKCLEIIKSKQITDCSFTFSISPFSNKDDFYVLNSSVEVFDLKNKEHIDFIKINYDLVFSIHCKQIFPVDLVNKIKCINVHPGYNPLNRGWYPQVFSIINKLPIGATIHEMDEKLDNGAIIAREFVNKNSYDTSKSLYNKIVEKEIELFKINIESIIKGNYNTSLPEGEGTLYLKKDFRELLELDLNEVVIIGDFIDKLRALTHGDFKNAYFIDPLTKEKIFVGISLRNDEND